MSGACARIPFSVVTGLLVFTAFTGGCGGDSKAEPTPGPTSASPGATATSAAPTTSATASAAATAVTYGPNDPEGALAAALIAFDGLREPDCKAPGNSKPCVSINSATETVKRGIATFGLAAPSGGGGALGVMGRNQAGEWRRWLTTQQTYHLLSLPGEIRVCADGEGVNVRELPSTEGKLVQTVADNTIMRAEQFILTTPGVEGTAGIGWYQVTSPVTGWARSDLLSNASYPDCSLRDAMAGTPRTPTVAATVTPAR
jgi:hypothetical protein